MNAVQSKARLLNSKEAAEYLGISTRTLWTLSTQGKIPTVRITSFRQYAMEDLEAFIEANKQLN